MKSVIKLFAIATFAIMSCRGYESSTDQAKVADVIIYGGTSAAITAAVQIARMNKSVIIVSPDIQLGGMSSSGLGFTDTGDKSVIGGLAREFYHRIYNKYQNPENWKWQRQEDYGNVGQGTPAIDGENKTMWIFEPHIAEEVFEDLVNEYSIVVYRDEWLNREKGVILRDGKIVSIETHNGNVYQGRVFIDATYEGDLMASAGVKYHVGRESNNVYSEKWNGVQVGVLHHRHHFSDRKISPYVDPQDPAKGVLPRVSTENAGNFGEGDDKIQAYCFRLCLTRNAENQIPFKRPEGYDSSQYELLTRVYESGWDETFQKFSPIPNLKTDVNNHGPFSFDNIGKNYEYPEASYERRMEIIEEHTNYQQGWLYFVANDPRVPEEVRNEMNKWGLAKDEFAETQHWPHQIYVREARRMIGEFVMTESEILGKNRIERSIGMGSYTMDSHNVQRYITDEGFVQNEGDIGVHPEQPYKIALGTIMPKRDQCANLLVPVAVSSSHIAFGSIRMEPVFMILGQSAGTVASLAVERSEDIHDVAYLDIRYILIQSGQILGKND